MKSYKSKLNENKKNSFKYHEFPIGRINDIFLSHKKVSITKRLALNDYFDDSDLKYELLNSYKMNKELQKENVSFYSRPFRHFIFNNIFPDEFYNKLEDYMQKLTYLPQKSDLYSFKQDLKFGTRNNVIETDIQKIFRYKLSDFLREITGENLSRKLDISAFQYTKTDVLLCHDDVKSTRKFAFVFYILPDKWKCHHGGNLRLFSCKSESIVPYRPEKIVSPIKNTLIIFEVSPISFHDVSEILTDKYSRISITGWFHMNTDNFLNSSHINIQDPLNFIITEILHPYITNIANNSQFKNKLSSEGSVQISSFLNNCAYEQLKIELNSDKLVWSQEWLPHSYQYEKCNYASINSKILSLFSRLFSSETFLQLFPLQFCQFPTLHPNLNRYDNDYLIQSNTWIGSLFKFTHGSYFLSTDSSTEFYGDHLDIFYHVTDQNWHPNYGSTISYHEPQNGQSILSFSPYQNTLTIVINNDGIRRVQTYINSNAISLGPIFQFHLRIPIRILNNE